MKKYTVSINVAQFRAVIADNTSGKEYPAKLQPYTRTKDGVVTQYLQIAFDAKKLGCDNKGIVQVPKNDAGKFMTTFDTDLDNRRSNPAMKLCEDMFA